MDQFNGDFDKYSTAFKLAQACSGVDDDSILVDTLQRGVTQQLAIMMTAAALPDGQEKTSWKWEQWLKKQESSTEMWYDSGNSEVGEIAISHQCKQCKLPNLLGTPMPWKLTRSTSLLETEQNTCETTNALSVTRRDATCPSIRDTPEAEENPCNKEHNPPGGLPRLGKLREIHGSTTS